MAAILDYLILHHLPGLSFVNKKRMLAEMDFSVEKVLRHPSLLSCYQQWGFSSNKACRSWAETEWQRVKAAGMQLISIADSAYPQLLREIADPPLVLYAKGRLELLQHPLPLAVVGARKVSVYGQQVARYLGTELAAAGCCLVSGLALGVDGIIHEAALEVAAEPAATIGVLGCGLEQIYPRQHQRLFASMQQHGLIISEFALGAAPEKYHFPRRNRIISGLALGTVVVEAAQRSGALITARYAMEQGRSVFAAPQPILSPAGAGNNALLRQGATLVSQATDIMEEIMPQARADLQKPKKPIKRSRDMEPAFGSLADAKVFALVQQQSTADTEMLTRLSGLPAAEVVVALSQLQLQGMIQCGDDGRYSVCR